MANTRGQLKPASIYDAEDTSLKAEFMFNPHEYTITLTHKFKDDAGKGGKKSKVELTQVGQKQLTLPKLVFDTYDNSSMTGSSTTPPQPNQSSTERSVENKTKPLFDLMAPKEAKKGQNSQKFKARLVVFEWGTVKFNCYIEQVKQKFTLFLKDGTPVRAEVEVKLKQVPVEQQKQNPTSGDGPIQRIWRVSGGDRLDGIAAEVYGDATLWRQIAEYNQIDNPLALKAGTELSIPPQE